MRLASLFVALCIVAPSVHAQEVVQSTASAEARLLFERGIEAYSAQQFPQALELFDQSRQKLETPAALLNLVFTAQRLGRFVLARETLNRYLVLAAGRMPPGREQQVQQIATELSRSVVTLSLRVDEPSLEVTLDGRTVDPATFRQAIAIDPGIHTFRATGEGRRPLEITRALHPGETLEVPLLPEKIEDTTMLSVSTSVPEAEIVLDGLVMGNGHFESHVLPGAHDLEVRMHGYTPYESPILALPGKRTEQVVRLVRIVPLHERPGLWLGVGATILAGLATGLLVGLSGPGECTPGTVVLGGNRNGCIETPVR